MFDPSALSVDEMKAVVLDLEKERLEKSLYEFTVAAWRHVDSAPFAHGGFALQAVCEHLEACVDGHIRNLIINIPPRFSKSTITGTMLPAWTWAQRTDSPTSGAGVQFLHSGYALNLSLQDSVKCRRLMTSKWYQRRWGDRFKLLGDQNTKTRFENDRNGIRNTVSVGSATTGLGGAFLIADDPNNAQEANSEAIVASTNEWWDMAWSTRLNDPKTGCRIVVQQRLSEQDITGHILSKDVGEWTHLMLPMRFEPERRIYTVLVPADMTEDGEAVVWTDPRETAGELLWPERFGESEIDLLERTLGPYAAAGQLQQRPEPAGGGIIKRVWWEPWENEQFPDMEFIVASVDTAYGAKEHEGDFSAMTVWGVWRDSGETTAVASRNGAYASVTSRIEKANVEADVPKVMLMYAWQQRLELHELVTKIGDTCRKLKVDLLLVENKASGISVAQEIRRIFGGETFGVRLIDPKGIDKVSRTYAIQHLFSEGLIHAPVDRVWCDMVITQSAQFPKAKHDDLHDTATQALSWLRQSGMIQRGAERTAELADSKLFRGNTNDLPLYPV